MTNFEENQQFYKNNADFKQYVDRCVKTYGKTVEFMMQTPIADAYREGILDGHCGTKIKGKEVKE